MQGRFTPSRLGLLIPALLVLPLQAQEANSNASQQDTASIEKLQVWGTEVRSSSLYLDSEALAARQADHISDLLRVIPGIDVGGAHSLNQKITIRAMDDRDLKISIDGASQNSYMFHHMGNLQIHADILKAVDIDVGTNSVVNGGLGGSVRFETKDARDLLDGNERFGARAQYSYHSNDARNYALTAYGQATDSLDFLAYYNRVDRNNYKVGGGEITDEHGVVIPGTDGRVRGLAGELDDLLLKSGWDISDNQRLSLSFERYQDEGDYSARPDMGLATDLAFVAKGLPLTFPTRFSRDTLTAHYNAEIGDGGRVRLTAYRNDSTLIRDEDAYRSKWPDWAAEVTGDAQNTGISALVTQELGQDIRHQFTWGGEWNDYETHYSRIGDIANESSAETMDSMALFVEDRIRFGESFSLIPGLRYERANLDAVITDNSFDNLGMALALEYRLIEPLLLRASVTELFKAPEIGEVFTGAGLGDKPNQDIKAETGSNSELAFAYADEVLGADRFSLGLTLFRTLIDNYIYDYAGRGLRDNVGDLSNEGGEAYVGYRLGDFDALLTYSASDSSLDSFPEYETSLPDGSRLYTEQGDTLSLMLDYQLPVWDLSLHWESQWVDDLPQGADIDGASLSNAKAGFDVHNASLRYLPSGSLEGLAVTFGVDNLFDEYYASQSSRTGVSLHPRFGELSLTDYEPGRNIKLTVSYDF
ncbi:TonB-dependent receptor [Shewanella sp. JM162201]|uniref:TonB-dependent receptor n=1 Tax=Shewanella jiangmenensis TaxID=2837387 RepID=A0ABS5V0D4_9GAMM|nr:TonB-dependent receptor [Shewanella jiangmenensis]MBT1443922.1 TonB-dependent receptor [Shewanella jiangmenensis]